MKKQFIIFSLALALHSYAAQASANIVGQITQTNASVVTEYKETVRAIIFDNGEVHRWSKKLDGDQEQQQLVLRLAPAALANLRANIKSIDRQTCVEEYSELVPGAPSSKVEVGINGQLVTLWENRGLTTYICSDAYSEIDVFKQTLALVESVLFTRLAEPGFRAPGSK